MSKPAESSASDHPGKTTHRWVSPFSLTAAFSFCCLCLLALLFFLQWDAKLDYLRTELDGTLRQVDECLTTDRHFLQQLADRSSDGTLDDEEFQSRTSQYLNHHTYLNDIVQIDRGFILRQSVTTKADHRVGLKLPPESEHAARRAQTTGQPTYAGPFVGLQNQHFFALYVPIVRNGAFLGSYGGLYAIDTFQAYFAAELLHENLSLFLTDPSLHTPEQIKMKTGFKLMAQSQPIDEIPELRLTLTEPFGVRSLGTFFLLILVMALVMVLAGWLSHTSLRLAQELKKRRAVEAELRRSEELYHSIFDHAGHGIVLATCEGRILQVNKAFAQMLGYTPDDLKERALKEITHPNDLVVDQTFLQKTERGGQDYYRHEKRYIGNQGQTVWGNLTVTCLYREDGSPEFMVGMVTDITERHLAEQALLASEERYRTLYNSMAQGVIYQEADGRISSTNRATCEMFGLSEDEILGRTSLHPDWKVIREDGSDFPGPEHPSMVALTTGQEVRGAVAGVYNPQRGSIRWLNINAIPEFRDGEDKPFRAFVTLHDFTELKLTLERLEESEKRYRLISNQFQTLLNAIPDPMFMLDQDGSVSWHNQATKQLLGTDEGLGQFYCKDYFDWLNLESNTIIQNSFNAGHAQEIRLQLEEDKPVTLRIFPVHEQSSEVQRVLIQIYDETEKIRQQETLLRTGQLAAAGELAAGVAHEINNPINGVINYAQILVNNLPEGSDSQKYAERILAEGDRVAAIASSLLAFTRESSAERRPVPLHEIFAESLLLAGTKMRNEGILIDQNISAALPDLMVSPQQIQQVFLNLFSNARHALNAKETIEPKTLTISANMSNEDSLQVIVRDNGIGIPENILTKVQDPFFTTKAKAGGTGLGLSICNDILALHGSRLVIESREGGFTAISFKLPCVTAQSKVAAEAFDLS
ncbi:MAG TPA: PAS domain S-box protein [Geothermobacteraceae bacterium]|nr:PAS domain S-box protein [Geothermobacteraceae bacterium]